MCVAQFEQHGFAIIDSVLNVKECAAIDCAIDPLASQSAGSRNLLLQPWCIALARRLRVDNRFSMLLPPDFIAVQCTYFEKAVERNWLVPIHQDLSIPVAERIDHPLLSGWSEKEGCWYVQPPVALLEQLLIVRLHLDPCGAADGALRVVPGSHLGGRLDIDAVQRQRSQRSEKICCVERGGTLIMRPLLLHASSKATGLSKRRVLHFVFGPVNLPYGLQWASVVY
ncbi:MAG: phytanoyl-CoA dioxygenase family protein [Pseudomonadota bacterium]